MARKLEDTRVRVERLLTEEGSVEDLNKVLSAIRFQTFGHALVKDVADLSAHDHQRDRGLMYEGVRDMGLAMRLHFEGLQHPRNVGSLPTFFPEGTRASVRTLSDEKLREFSRRKPSLARRLVEAGLKKLRKNQDGTFDARPCDADEWDVLNLIGGSFSAKPVYDAKSLTADLRDVLLKNLLISATEAADLEALESKLAVFVFALFHRVDVQLPTGDLLTLDGGFTRTCTIWKSPLLGRRATIRTATSSLRYPRWRPPQSQSSTARPS